MLGGSAPIVSLVVISRVWKLRINISPLFEPPKLYKKFPGAAYGMAVLPPIACGNCCHVMSVRSSTFNSDGQSPLNPLYTNRKPPCAATIGFDRADGPGPRVSTTETSPLTTSMACSSAR
jgi:hypothetical protein